MAIRIAKLVDWEEYKKKSQSEQDKLKRERGYSKSGLDWDQEEEPGVPKTWDEMAEGEEADEGQVIQEWGLDEEDDDPTDIEGGEDNLKALVKSIHKHAAELYNMCDDMDDPEEWVMEKAKDCASKIREIHGHVDYNKQKAEELPPVPGMDNSDRGW